MKKCFFLILLSFLLTSCGNPLPYKPDCAILAAPIQTTPTPNIIAPYYRPSKYACYPISNGEICGYDCKIAGGRIKCGTFPGQRCMVGLSDYIACGFDCKRSRTGFVKCGLRYGDRCIETASGSVICGLNCRIFGGFIKCDESPDFRPLFAEERI